jgi:hypothetical protein
MEPIHREIWGQSETPVAKIKISPVVLPLFYETMGSLKDGIF